MLDRNILELKGIGPKKAKILKDESSIETIEDLLYYTPRRYVDRSTFKMIKDCFLNEIVTVAGTIENIKVISAKKKFIEVEIHDGTDTLSGIFFGSTGILKRIFKIGDFVIFSGKIQFYKSKQIIHPEFDFLDSNSKKQPVNTGRIIPLYRSTEKLKQKGFDSRGFRRIIRSAIDNFLDYFIEFLDGETLQRYNLPGIKESISAIHFPDSFEQAEHAKKRLAFNEIFFLQYYLYISKKYFRNMYTRKRDIGRDRLDTFILSVPFNLTDDQQKAIEDIRDDMLADFPMSRLIQGDVGSGKTIVAMAASIMASSMGLQTAIMAPTEILASQHFENFKKMMPDNISLSLLTGSLNKSFKNTIYRDLKLGNIHILIGTHALIEDSVEFNNLGLVIIDEQQRFGVGQRAKLRSKGANIDLLVMTATPIPRSLSLTLYGDLDISYLREKPAGRDEIKTIALPAARLKSIYNSLEKYISQGRQVYYILPLIEESENIDLKSATEVYKNLKDNIFPHRIVELIHGRLKQDVKKSVMEKFKSGSIDILVSTTVIEVGIDIHNANIIVIEHAERFGLAQLHQLRGRIGRGKHESFCVLVYPENISGDSMLRIQTLVNINDGFRISEEDLKLRGAGELIGTRQHGYESSFEFLDLVNDSELIINARAFAAEIAERVNDISLAFHEMESGNGATFHNRIRTKKILSLLS